MENDKYDGVDPEIADKLRLYEAKYFREDKTIPFKGMTIYPVLVHDYEVFANCSSCLVLNKNEDVQGIRMSHLEYILRKTILPGEEGLAWQSKLAKIFEICFHVKRGIKCINCGEVIEYSSKDFLDWVEKIKQFKSDSAEAGAESPKLLCPKCQHGDFIDTIKIFEDPNTKKMRLFVGGIEITKADYNELRQILLFQNFPDYRDESHVDPDIKKDHDEKMKLERKMNDCHASLEEKIVCLSIATGYEFEYIYNMSIRKFSMALERVDDLINYKIMRQATMSGFVQLPKGQKIEHWIYKPNKDMYGDDYKTLDSVKAELS